MLPVPLLEGLRPSAEPQPRNKTHGAREAHLDASCSKRPVWKLLLLINDWKELSWEVKQTEKTEQKCCADAIAVALAEFLLWPPPLLFCVKQICK